MSTNDDNRLGNNIRSLCKNFRETQAQLAEYLQVDERTLRKYIAGDLNIDDITKLKIAKHYMVSVQQLMFSDLTRYNHNLSVESVNNSANKITYILPIFETDKALCNISFRTAYTLHNNFYDSFQNIDIKNVDSMKNVVAYFDSFSDCLENYNEAYRDDEIKSESAANYIALYHFLSYIKQSSSLILNKTALINTAIKLMPSIKNNIKDISNIPENELSENILDTFPTNTFISNSSMQLETLNEMMKTIHKSQQYIDLAQYYDALELINNISDSNSEWESKKQSGIDMLKQFAKYGNIYAERYLVIFSDTI